jgi:hypothetical protein
MRFTVCLFPSQILNLYILIKLHSGDGLLLQKGDFEIIIREDLSQKVMKMNFIQARA